MSEWINNHSRRKEKLKEALKQIHAGKPYQQVKEIFAELLQQASAQEIAEIEQSLITEGLPVEDIQYLCDVHVDMFRESLDQQKPAEMTPGHPVYTFNAENELANLQLNQCRLTLSAAEKNTTKEKLAQFSAALGKLMEYDCHYQRKENILFPYLEKYGFSGPSSVMWGIHDDIRKDWKAMQAMLSEDGLPSEAILKKLQALFTQMENAMREMFYKEERILFPNALERLTEKDWLEVYDQEEDFGFSFVKRGTDWLAVTADQMDEQVIKSQEVERMNSMSEFPLTTGDLTLSQINLMLTTLPVDVTFVDEHDVVRYFSETPERIFKRTPAIIGRKVQNCHPPASVDKVLAIVEDFRSGKRDTAEFWIQMGGKFIHIRYFAMRDAQGAYRGTLEVSQDITALRQLEGEKRLLDE